MIYFDPFIMLYCSYVIERKQLFMGKKSVHGKVHRFFGRLAAPGVSEWREIHERKTTTQWKDMDAMHEVMHDLPGPVKALIIEMLEKPLSFEEIWDYFTRFPRFERKLKKEQNLNKSRAYIEDHINRGVEEHIFYETNGNYHLTPKGLEMAHHMQEAIPVFIGNIFSPKMVSVVTIVIHILLTAIKCGFGVIFHSAGLLSDGIDNGVDTISSVLVWLGIKFDREKLSSFLIIIMMFVSLIGIAIASINKIINPGPVREGLVVFIVSGVCGILMLFISIYQYVVGKRTSNFAIMCQSVDSRNHFLTSLLVCFGIILSILAERRDAFWLYYADAAASIAIGCLILKSAIELLVELVKPGGKPEDVSHFMGKSQERMKRRLIFMWLSDILRGNPLTEKELERIFTERFCKGVPKIFTLSGFGYSPQSSEDLHVYLEYFLKSGKLIIDGDTYHLANNESK
jgi:Co/Zn/Cd efflux system component